MVVHMRTLCLVHVSGKPVLVMVSEIWKSQRTNQRPPLHQNRQLLCMQGIIEAAISCFAERQPIQVTSTALTGSKTVMPSLSSAPLSASGDKHVRSSHS